MRLFFGKEKLFGLASLFLFFAFPFYGSQYEKLSAFLNGYLAGNLELKNAVLEARSKALALKTVRIDNGPDFTFSTGSLSFAADMDGNTTVKLSPSFSVSAPLLNDGKIEFSLPYTSEKGNSYFSGGSLSVGAGLISGAAQEAGISVLEAERALLQAERNVRQQTLAAEKEFYTKLKTLYNYIISIQTAKNSLYEDLLDLKVLELQGYSKNSARYRQAFLDSESSRREIQEKQRLLEKETVIFAKKCGLEYSREREADGQSGRNGQTAMVGQTEDASFAAVIAFLPDAIPFLQEADISSYEKEKYASIEKANWDKSIAQLKREADRDLSLSAAGEYKFNSTQSGYDDAGGKITLDWRGISASAGAYLPVGSNVLPENKNSSSAKNDNPYFQFSLSVNPSQWRLSSIKKQQDSISAQEEEIAVKNALDEYETKILESLSTVQDIKWAHRSYTEQYDMYLQLEADMKKWLEEGSVTESDWLDAANNLQKAKFNLLINSIDMIVYNTEVEAMFYDD